MSATAAVATSARERPILFSGPMVRAILDGRKTQTRRIIRDTGTYAIDSAIHGAVTAARERKFLAAHCPHGVPGDRLWVREGWSTRLDRDHLKPADLDLKYDGPFFWADPETANTGCGGAAGRKRASFHLPRWASRLTLEITEVRVQRLQEISEEDARAEGVRELPLQEGAAGAWWTADVAAGLKLQGRTAASAFKLAWDEINLKRAPWPKNPWAFAITFRRLA